jgi:Ca-activated chloride channel homolog
MFLQLPSTSRVPALFPTTPEGASAGAELVTSDGRALALTAARLIGEAGGGIARLVLEQTFANHDSDILKVTYRMPLPADGAVSGYEFVIGDRTVKGVVDKKQKARERFERAIASGHTAALLEQERADIFTQQIGNIPAGERVIARITIDQRLAWLPEGEWELRFPTVIGPRYIGRADSIDSAPPFGGAASPGRAVLAIDDAKATHVKVANKPLTVTFQIGLTISDAITAGAKPSSPSHALTQQGSQITLASGARLDRDIVVRWPVAAAAPGLALNVARRTAGDAYGLITIVPPARAAKATPVARDLLVLLDTSGSMGGAPLEKAQQVVALMIDSLAGEDRLELIEFSDSPKRWRDEPAQADAKTKSAAIKWVRSRVASGGTEMRAAVIASLTTLRIGAQRQVVLVTDGYVGGEQQILEALHRKLPMSCRLHVLGVGSAVNRSLATALSRAGRGAEVIVGPDEDAERGAKRLLDRTKLPMLTNVELAGSALQRHAPEKLPDVFEGAPLVAALMVNPEGGELVVRGQLAEGTWEQRITVPAKRLGEGNQAIAALYGRERVADVESHAMFESVNGEIEELGLMFQIATKMTSWVAVDDSRVTGGPYRDELVPQELPYGTSAGAFGLRTASAGYIRPAESAPSAPMFALPMGMPAMFGYGGGMQTRSGTYTDTASFDDKADGEFSEEEPTGETSSPPESSQPTATRSASAEFKVRSPQQIARAQDKGIEDLLQKAPEPKKPIVPDPLPKRGKPPGSQLTPNPVWWAYVGTLLFVLILLALLWYLFG